MSGLYLGPVVFQDFEVPGRIAFGGQQLVAIHQLPGGARVIDAMGRDDAPLAWTGTFSGPSAASRALQLDLMRAQGQPWSLAWSVLSYLVIVTEFSASYERENWIPYRITCSVVADQTTVLAQGSTSVVEDILADLAAAAGISGVDVSSATLLLAGESSVIPGTGAFAAAGAALGTVANGIVAGLVTAGSSLANGADFPSTAAAAQQVAQLASAQGYVQRAQTNLANAGN